MEFIVYALLFANILQGWMLYSFACKSQRLLLAKNLTEAKDEAPDPNPGGVDPVFPARMGEFGDPLETN